MQQNLKTPQRIEDFSGLEVDLLVLFDVTDAVLFVPQPFHLVQPERKKKELILLECVLKVNQGAELIELI